MEKQIQDFLEADVLDNAPAIIALHDMDHNVVWANKAYLKARGLSLQDVTGKKCHLAWGAGELCRNCPVKKVIETGEPCEAELTHQNNATGTGKRSFLLVKVAPVRDREGGIIGVVEVAFDITERKRAEEALREGQDMLRMHSGQSLMGIIVLQDELFVYVNERAARIMDVSVDEVAKWSPREYAELIHPDDLAFVMEQGRKKQLGEDGAVINYIWRMVTPAGNLKWIDMWSRTVSFDGRTADMVMMIDITERKRAEEALKQSEERLSAFMDSATDAFTIWSADLDLIDLNQTAATYLPPGSTRDGVIGTHITEFLPDSKILGYYDRYIEVVRTGTPISFEGHFLYPGYGDRILNARAFKVGDGLGIITTDITKRKQAEAEKARIEDQYSQVQRIESIGRLAGGVAHDLNNLLSPILGYGELLMGEFSPGDERLEAVSEIVNAGFRARDLVSQLLAFSRKQPLERKPQNLNVILKGIKKLLRHTIRKDIKIEIVAAPDIRSACVDLRQIEQVIMNLSVNAQDAMPEGGTLTFETTMVELDKDYAAGHPGTQAGEYINLTVSDTGCGMDDETRENIFEPFFTTKGEQGTGLGLATVYGIVKQHGGSIHLDSEPGKGTTFQIYLPVSGEPYVEAMIQENPVDDLRGSETILLVEDNVQVLKLTRTILVKHGYSVLVAESGVEALMLLASHDGPVHLLLTDVIMPRMNGRDLFSKATMNHPDLRVLYMSGYVDNVTALSDAPEEGVLFIQKPFTVQELAAKVRESLEA